MIELPTYHVKLTKADLDQTKNFDQRLFRNEKEVRGRRLAMLAHQMAGTTRLVLRSETADTKEAIFEAMPDHQRTCENLTETGQLAHLMSSSEQSMPLKLIVNGKEMKAPSLEILVHDGVTELWLGEPRKSKRLQISKSKAPTPAKPPTRSTQKAA